MRAKRKNLKQYVFDINKYYNRVICDLSEYDNPFCSYWFDTKSYSMMRMYKFLTELQKSKIDSGDDRFIKLPQLIMESGYTRLSSMINLPAVTDYFNNASDLEDAFYRYRYFIDNNCFIVESENYELYLSATQMLVDWCIENNINYVFEKQLPPDNYLYQDTEELKTISWNIPMLD